MEIQSVFFDHERIPKKFTCDSENINPKLQIDNIPKNAKSIAIILHDPDSALPGGFTHWVIWNIPIGNKIIIYENSTLGIVGKNTANKTGYIGPCPPSGTHRYFFTVYALDIELNISPDANKDILENAMKNHILDEQELVGLYSKE